jgi:DNA-directed RNA polymerase specialized sigma24 family protein
MTPISTKEYSALYDGVKRMIWRKFNTYDDNMLADAVADTWVVVSQKGLPKNELFKLWARSAVNRYIDMLRTESRRRELNRKIKVEKETQLPVYSKLEVADEIRKLRKADRLYVLHIMELVASNSGEDLRTVAEAWFRDNISPRPRHLQDATKRIRDWVLALG